MKYLTFSLMSFHYYCYKCLYMSMLPRVIDIFNFAPSQHIHTLENIFSSVLVTTFANISLAACNGCFVVIRATFAFHYWTGKTCRVAAFFSSFLENSIRSTRCSIVRLTVVVPANCDSCVENCVCLCLRLSKVTRRTKLERHKRKHQKQQDRVPYRDRAFLVWAFPSQSKLKSISTYPKTMNGCYTRKREWKEIKQKGFPSSAGRSLVRY